MGSAYQSQTASGYSSSPPADDGSVTAANKIKYATLKTQLGDPVKGLADAINTALRSALNVTPTTQSAAYTTTTADHLRPIEVTGTTTISLGDAAAMVAQSMGYEVAIVNRGVATVTVSRITGTDTLNGAAKDIKLAPGQGVVCSVNSTSNGYNLVAEANGILFDPTDPSKQARFDVSLVTAAQQRALTVPDANTIIGPSVIAAGRNIAARTNAATPDTKLDITADEILLKDTNNLPFLARAVSGTINFGTTGANGLDTSTQAINTWYYGWVIAKPDGTVAVLGSTSSSAPTMPAGYTYKALVTAARSAAGPAFVKYRQFGNTVYYEGRQSALSGGTATVETAITLSSLIPSIAETFLSQVDLSQGTQTAATIYNVECRIVTGTNFYRQRMAIGTANDFGASTALIEFPSTGAFYYINSAANLATNIDVMGFKLPLGGE